MSGYVVLGAGFSILMKANGYNGFMAFLMSLIIYAGSMQYAGIGLFNSGASLFSVALTTLLVNARHLFYGLSLVDKYKKVGKKKLYMIFALTDETYSLVCNEDDNDYNFLVSLFDHVYWLSGTLIGIFLSGLLSFNTAGIDFALTALFITIFTEQWLSTKNHFAALAGLVSTILCLVLFGKDIFLLPAMACIVCCLAIKMRSSL